MQWAFDSMEESVVAVFELGDDPSSDCFINGIRQAQTFGLADGLQPSGQIDVMPVKITAFLYDFAEMQPDAKGYMRLCFSCHHRILSSHAALDRGHCRLKFGEKAVPHCLD